ncbi:MAG: nucleotidyltransferase domain-containing protein [Legionella sp.]|nr:nucleotidyltransferase domain-containing protein [Legionella sp.]
MTIKTWGLTREDIAKIRATLAQYPVVEKAILYGSRAKGNYRASSDIDITLVGRALQYHDLLSIAGDLDELLLPYTFDLSLWHQIDNEKLKDHIERVGELLYG